MNIIFSYSVSSGHAGRDIPQSYNVPCASRVQEVAQPLYLCAHGCLQRHRQSYRFEPIIQTPCLNCPHAHQRAGQLCSSARQRRSRRRTMAECSSCIRSHIRLRYLSFCKLTVSYKSPFSMGELKFTKLPYPLLQHLILARKHLCLCLIERRLVPRTTK
jgi:hypothetical protein